MEFNPTDRFIQNLNTQEIEQLLQIAENNPSQINIDQIISTCFTNSAEQSFPSQKNTFNNSNGKHKWFGQNCKKSRKLYNKARNKFTKYPTAYNKLTLQNTSKTYKATMNKYIKNTTQKM